ncbi:hypothetical protein N0B16_10290 [Chryseobacterium sp. GMJ5]|uniref:Uncharacterized protein n=1 Tax=Chryseobacterium gilvum TaxID=2976534 RepID=A0ABT2W285_9FLAO|nr:hypothetical protein [Chryseobacterium gilvum]MCU7614825.1 hypothetical protein [Chryseobacterium gilvum]
MKKTLVKWIFVKILLPLSEDLIRYVAKALSKYFLDLTKEKMGKWKMKEEESATTEAEKEFYGKKWDDRINDIEKMKSSMDEKIDQIVKEAMEKSEKRVEQIQNTKSEPEMLEAP